MSGFWKIKWMNLEQWQNTEGYIGNIPSFALPRHGYWCISLMPMSSLAFRWYGAEQNDGPNGVEGERLLRKLPLLLLRCLHFPFYTVGSSWWHHPLHNTTSTPQHKQTQDPSVFLAISGDLSHDALSSIRPTRKNIYCMQTSNMHTVLLLFHYLEDQIRIWSCSVPAIYQLSGNIWYSKEQLGIFCGDYPRLFWDLRMGWTLWSTWGGH